MAGHDAAPPMAHAIGGSLGSALALLLFYPLERARVEFQTTTTQQSHRCDINGKVQPTRRTSSRGGSSLTTRSDSSLTSQTSLSDSNNGNHQVQQTKDLRLSPSEESQELCPENFQRNALSKQSKQMPMSLISCLYSLHLRQELYRGVTPVVTTMACSNFVFFYTHSFLKQLLLPLSSQNTSLRLSLVASCLAGIVNVLLTNPLWVASLRIVTSANQRESQNKNIFNCNSRQQKQPSQNVFREMKNIAQKEGWVHLWNGTAASLLLVSNPVIQFACYEQLKTRLMHCKYGRSSLGTLPKAHEPFFLGAIAKAISTVLTYPMQLAQTMLRVQKQAEKSLQESANGNDEDEEGYQAAKSKKLATDATRTYKSTLDCLIQIYRRKGLQGWFAGMKTKLLQTVLTAALTFLTYEQIIKALVSVHRALLNNKGATRLNKVTPS